MSCCDDAATFLIEALGGEEVCKRVIGGTKWWQVRGIRGYVNSSSVPSIDSGGVLTHDHKG